MREKIKIFPIIGFFIINGFIACSEQTTAPANNNAVSAKSIAVHYENELFTISLSEPSAVQIEAESYANLADVVELADLDLALEAMFTDFESADGFKPATKEFCVDLIPMPANVLKKGYVHLQSRNLYWDEDLSFPGCMRVSNTAKIILSVQ